MYNKYYQYVYPYGIKIGAESVDFGSFIGK